MLSLHYTYLGDVILARELLDLGEGDKNATGKKLLLHFILLHWQIVRSQTMLTLKQWKLKTCHKLSLRVSLQ